MSEQHDPIRDLESFGTGGVTMTPIPPSEVRRLGNRRRARRHATYAAAAAVVVAVTAVPLGLSLGGGEDDRGPSITGTPSATPTVVTFPGGGVEVKSAADTDKLTGTSTAFRTFIAGVWKDDADQGCTNATVTVQKYSSAGYALGGVGGCGGYVALWVGQDGHWKEAVGTQDEWRCGDLSRFDVPKSFAGDCYGPDAAFGPTEDEGLRLGMSREEVLAAGGTVVGPGNACQGVTPRGLEPPKGSTLGYLSAIPGKGVVALFAENGQVTPGGIGVGSTRSEVERAYPDGHFDEMRGAWIVPIDASSHYRFDLDHDQVRLVSLEAEGTQDCYE
jgi:hypothetical protein